MQWDSTVPGLINSSPSGNVSLVGRKSQLVKLAFSNLHNTCIGANFNLIPTPLSPAALPHCHPTLQQLIIHAADPRSRSPAGHLHPLLPELVFPGAVPALHPNTDSLFLAAPTVLGMHRPLTKNGRTQLIIDIIVLVFFTLQVALYLLQKLTRNDNSDKLVQSWTRIFFTVEFVYDLFCVALALFLAANSNTKIYERLVELVFVFKTYKIIKLDLKITEILIGTRFYHPYKILRTLLIVFMAISYVGSLFYGIAYYLYTIDIPYSYLLWIIDTGAISDCIAQPFIIQVQYAMYWALGTASTAAYGDISAAEPTLVLLNILALAFQGFLFGFYLNTMHEIPKERKDRESGILEKFDIFQQNCEKRKIDNRLYLQILCSLQYGQYKKNNLQQIEALLPSNYLHQLKSLIYAPFFQHPVFPASPPLSLALHIRQTICQQGENLYNYPSIHRTDLLYLKQRGVRHYYEGQFNRRSEVQVREGQWMGVYGFVTGLEVQGHRGMCRGYGIVYGLPRAEYKLAIRASERLGFEELGLGVVEGRELELVANEPIVRIVQDIRDECPHRPLFDTGNKSQLVYKITREKMAERAPYQRYNISSKTIKSSKTSRRSLHVQTDNQQQTGVQTVHFWDEQQQSTRLIYKFNDNI